MSTINTNYNSYYAGYNSSNIKSTKKAEQEAVITNDSDYLSQLQSKYKSLTITVGSSVPNVYDMQGKVNTLSIHPSILQEMQNNPDKEKFYEQRISDIEGAMNWVQGLVEGMGFKCVSRFAYIDENGELWGGAINIRKDMLNEKLRGEAKENTEMFLKKSLEKNKKVKIDMEDELKEKLTESPQNKTHTIEFNSKEMNKIIEISKKTDISIADNERKNEDSIDIKAEINADGEAETETLSGKVIFNEGKRASQVAASLTNTDINMVMNMLNKDLSDCESGLENGFCDENEVSKVKAMIQKAQEKQLEISAGERNNKAKGKDTSDILTLNLLV